ncbi:predicted protein [Arabidopsis lyrata subsp. lyrata]|uniref:Predicted protein n=1 Tax=Arabidopsis lyrata subsp. lyrata TaxID=81972 RepID=D7MA92_ARALL|nr:predicted protein [Arabidopsis lyrata subsp. lyrata]
MSVSRAMYYLKPKSSSGIYRHDEVSAVVSIERKALSNLYIRPNSEAIGNYCSRDVLSDMKMDKNQIKLSTLPITMRIGSFVQHLLVTYISICMPSRFMEFNELPEIIRTPLQKLCLHIKSLQVGSICSCLAKALQPLDALAVENAIDVIAYKIGDSLNHHVTEQHLWSCFAGRNVIYACCVIRICGLSLVKIKAWIFVSRNGN